MSATEKIPGPLTYPEPPPNRLVSTATVPLVKHDHVSAEIESIKRTLYNAIDKLERIQRRDLITT